MSRLAMGLLVGLLVGGCTSPEVTIDVAGEVAVVPDSFSRERRRMNVDQLHAAVIAATGGISWTEQQEAGIVDMFDALSATLGKPDYLGATEEELQPALLFQKFLDDAAKKVCVDLIAAEQERPPGSRVLLMQSGLDDPPDSARARADLRAAILRFHGRSLPDGDARLEPWSHLLEQANASFGAELAWRTVCVALITHPDFYSY
jgi:hypothetical protein